MNNSDSPHNTTTQPLSSLGVLHIEEDLSFGSVPTTGEIVKKFTFFHAHTDVDGGGAQGAASFSDNTFNEGVVEKQQKRDTDSPPQRKTPIASFISYGASLLSFHCPQTKKAAGKSEPLSGPDGKPLLPLSSDVVVGYDTIEAFAAQPAGPYFGVTVGRYCNRIAKGKFSLLQPEQEHGQGQTFPRPSPTTTGTAPAGAPSVSGAEAGINENAQTKYDLTSYTLNTNNGPNHLHGGPGGFHHLNWRGQVITNEEELRLHMDQYRYFAVSATEQGPLGSRNSSSQNKESSGATSSSPSTWASCSLPSSLTFPCLAFTLTSGDGDEGYPGELSVCVLYSMEVARLEGEDEHPNTTTNGRKEEEEGVSAGHIVKAASTVYRLRIDHLARLVNSPQSASSSSCSGERDMVSTVINMTNHAYFNLSAVNATLGDKQRETEERERARAAEEAAARAWHIHHPYVGAKGIPPSTIVDPNTHLSGPLSSERYRAYIGNALASAGHEAMRELALHQKHLTDEAENTATDRRTQGIDGHHCLPSSLNESKRVSRRASHATLFTKPSSVVVGGASDVPNINEDQLPSTVLGPSAPAPLTNDMCAVEDDRMRLSIVSSTAERSQTPSPLLTFVQSDVGGDKSTRVDRERNASIGRSKTPAVVAPAFVTDYSIASHHLAVNARYFTPTDSTSIPTGELRSVSDDEPFDFFYVPSKEDEAVTAAPATVTGQTDKRSFFDESSFSPRGVVIGKRIGEGIGSEETSDQIRIGRGYDHNWCLEGFGKKRTSNSGPELEKDASPSEAISIPSSSVSVGVNMPVLAAVLTDPMISKRFLRVFTTQPGVQFYSGNFLDGTIVGKEGKIIEKRGGLCLETQHYPDSPNHPHFPSTVLRPLENYHQTTVYELGNML